MKTSSSLGLGMPLRRCAWLALVLLTAWVGTGSARAQATARFSYAITTLGGGFSGPEGVAVDGSGNVYVADTSNSVVKEMAVGCASSTCVTTLGGGFSYPEGVAVDGSGNVYVPDYGNSAVDEMPPGCASSSCVTTLGGGFYNPSGVAVDGNGNVYVADFGNNAVKEMPAGCASSSCVTTLGGGFYWPVGVAVDGSGNVYVADSGYNAVYEMPAGCASSSCVTTLVGGLNPDGVAVDGSGNVYVADYAYGMVKEVPAGCASSSCVTTLAGGFNGPFGVAVDGRGNVYVADRGNNAVKEIFLHGANFGQVPVGTTSAPMSLTFTFNAAGSIGTPVALTQGAQNLDFADAGTGTCDTNGTSYSYAAGDTCTVNVTLTPAKAGPRYGAAQLVNSSSSAIATAYIYGIGLGPQVAFSPGTISTLGGGFSPFNVEPHEPFGGLLLMAVDGSGNVYVTEYYAGTLSAVQEVPTGCASSSCVTTLGGGFKFPLGVAVDGSGNVYVADIDDNAVKEMPAGCASSSCVTTLGGGFSGPSGVAVDGSGNVYVANIDNNAVYEMPPGCASSSCVTTLGGGFYIPKGVAVDVGGNVYVADNGNSAVKEIPRGCASSSCVTTLGGGFNLPFDVAVDGSGNVYVADIGSVVNEMPPGCASSSCVTTVGGGFNNPLGVAVDGSGNVYVADTGNGAVKEVDVTDPPSLSFATTTVGVESSDSPQTVTLENIGNAALSFPVPATGNNPSISSSFVLDASTTCPQLSSSSSAATLAAGTMCALAVDFIPQSSGAISGSLAVTDNNLNAVAPTYATQSIGLSGTGVGLLQPTVTFTGAPSSAAYGTTFIVASTTNASTTAVITSSGACSNVGTSVTMTSGTGTCSLLATWAADSKYAATTAPQYTTATLATPTVTFTGAPASAAYGSTFNVATTTNASTTAVITSSGACSNVGNAITMTSGTGTCSLLATWAADNNYSGTTAPQSTAASEAATTATISSVTPSSEAYGSGTAVTVQATLNWTGSGPPPTSSCTGAPTLAFASTAGGRYGTPTLVGSSATSLTCQAIFTPTATDAAGTYTITASYAGNSNYGAASSTQTNNFRILTDTPSVKVTANPECVEQGSTAKVTVTATFTGAGGGDTAPAGTVTFSAPTGTFSGQSCSSSKDVTTCAASYVPTGKLAVGTYNNYLTVSMTAAGNYTAASGSVALMVTPK